ncbi:MFS domain-containing protein [Fusarium keratoplasticum]|uniref:MFS domain-containing protein n=1 Tax=Fusarium keratoplasticum TaxID=1328300 RepID=A0ACC0QHN5_9HYPO|nr:MFS domain-containing protein [Fusarium keratoplasticum]KAI8654744.1 MFS domain-containing protein [Fusarium keratoplasticum]
MAVEMASTSEASLWRDPYESVNLPGDKNPVNFSPGKKARVVAAGVTIIVNSALGSSLPSGAASDIAKEFCVTAPLQLVLLNSIYMLGFAIGPLIFGPLSEHVGRRIVLIGTYLAYMVFTLCCAVSPTYGTLLLFRLLCGIAAAAPNAVVGPLFADIYDRPEPRGRSMAYFMCATSMTPPFGPIISGYATRVSWRLTFWIGLAIAGVCLPLVVFLPETYVPVLKKKPFVMITKEPVVLFSALYLALIYSTLYLFFQAYPIIFQGVYGLSYGEVGLTFLPVTAGSVLALVIFLCYSAYHSSAMKAGAPWAAKIEYRRLPLACAGGPMIVISLFWLGWTAYPSIHPAVPAVSGLFFGAGYLIIFIALLNYITDAYRQFSASAQASASTLRSITAVCLPLAAPQMYHKLGVQWACSLLAFVTLGLALIPFVFIRYGEALRKRSPFCQKLAQAPSMIVAT